MNEQKKLLEFAEKMTSRYSKAKPFNVEIMRMRTMAPKNAMVFAGLVVLGAVMIRNGYYCDGSECDGDHR